MVYIGMYCMSKQNHFYLYINIYYLERVLTHFKNFKNKFVLFHAWCTKIVLPSYIKKFKVQNLIANLEHSEGSVLIPKLI